MHLLLHRIVFLATSTFCHCCLFALTTLTAAESPLPRLRVLTYNIHHGEGVDRKLDLPRLAKVMLAAKPDVIAVQEVDQNTKRTGQIDQPAELARLTDMHYVYGSNFPLEGGGYGNLILSKLKITSHENHLLPRIDQSEQRGVLVASLAWPAVDQPLTLYATHFDYRGDNRERIASAKFINELVAKSPADHLALLAGDLNDVAGSEPLKALTTTWSLANDQPLPTIPVDKPTQQIDFVLFRPQTRWKVLSAEVLEEAIASDHRALVVEFELQLPSGRAR